MLFREGRLHRVERLGQVAGQAFEEFDLPVIDVVVAEAERLLDGRGMGDDRRLPARAAAQTAQQLDGSEDFGHAHHAQIAVLEDQVQGRRAMIFNSQSSASRAMRERYSVATFFPRSVMFPLVDGCGEAAAGKPEGAHTL